MHIDLSNGCIGCTACYSVCPVNAIKMGTDKRGFYIPVINNSLCIDCGKCVKVCPLMTDSTKVINDDESLLSKYAYSLNKCDIQKSASGGVFYLMAKSTITVGGVVCGCVWGDGFVAQHICTDNMTEVEKMRGSKYVQSDMKKCFSEIKNTLNSGRKVLFSGTPCQTTALHNFLGKNYENLTTCALICGGVPSPKILRIYLNALEKKYKSKLSHMNMRSKSKGWLVSTIELEFENGKRINEIFITKNLYGFNFGQGLFINDMCMQCKFKLNSVKADLLIGDHWGIKTDMLKSSNNSGASAVIILTHNGETAFEAIASDMYVESGDITAIAESHTVLTKNHKPNSHRDEFFANVTEDNITELFSSYYPDILPQNTIKRLLLKALYATGLYIPVYTLRWKTKNKRKSNGQ